MAQYNLTLLKEATTLRKLFVTGNSYTSQSFTGMMMIAIFFVTFMALKKYQFPYALLSSSFACFILSIFLTYANLLNFIFPLIFLTITAFTGLYIYTTDRN